MGYMGNLLDFTVPNVHIFVGIQKDDKDNKYPNENTHSQEFLHVWYAKSNTSPIYPIMKIPKSLNLISLGLGEKTVKTCKTP